MIKPIAEQESAKLIHKLYVDMYYGDGKENPSVIVRIDRLEQIVNKLGWVAGITLAGVITELLRSVIK